MSRPGLKACKSKQSRPDCAMSDPGLPEHIAEFKRFAEDFKAESDRAAVILGAAKLDTMLLQILQAKLVPCSSGKDDLLEGDNPLGTFSARINMAFRLGLISAEFSRALHLIRKIRNSYAHEFSGVSLSAGSHRDRVRELVQPFSQHAGFKWVLNTFFGGLNTPPNEFRAVVATLSIRLEGAFGATTPLLSSSALELLPADYEERLKEKRAQASEQAKAPASAEQAGAE
jgi:hypothetical protein